MRSGMVFAFVLVFMGPAAWADEASDASNAVRDRFAGYLDAFNAGDADRVAEFYSDDATSLDEETGERTVGKSAIVSDFREFFAESPGAKVTGGVDRVQMIRPDVALLEGTVTLFMPDSEPTPSAYTAVLAKEAGSWAIASSQERELPSPATPAAALSDLEWLIGEWRDDTPGVDVQTTVRWSPSKAFLLRSFRADFGDGEGFEGTQVIGWDPHAKRFRTWTFQSDGSFGDGVVSRSGDDLMVRLSHVRVDGSLSTETQLIERVDENTLRVERIGETIDGVPAAPGEAVTVVRQDPQPKPPADRGQPQ